MQQEERQAQLKSNATKILEEQIKWEANYAKEINERLKREREEKEMALKKAEERRREMLQKFEEEELELQQIMNLRRQETLAKIREHELKERELLEMMESKSILNSMPSVATLAAQSVSKTNVENLPIPSIIQVAEVAIPVRSSEQQYCKEYHKAQDIESAIISVGVPAAPIASSEQNSLYTSTVNLPPAAPLTKSLSPPKTASKTNNTYEIRVKLLSSWGNTRVVGLSQVFLNLFNFIKRY